MANSFPAPALVIEHLEEDFYEWCQYEYERIAKHILPHRSLLHITNFTKDFTGENVKCHGGECVNIFPKERVCLLDSEAPQVLSPEDAQTFDYFLLGGILGNVDDFDFDRTSVLREQGYARRSLGNMQMTTDTAAMVTSLIVHQGKQFDELDFVDRPEFPVNTQAEGDQNLGSQEMLVMNFRYLKREQDGAADIDPRILALAMNDREFDLQDLQ